jgi:hypothetical protein
MWYDEITDVQLGMPPWLEMLNYVRIVHLHTYSERQEIICGGMNVV